MNLPPTLHEPPETEGCLEGVISDDKLGQFVRGPARHEPGDVIGEVDISDNY